MWTRKDCAQALLAAVLFLVVGLLCFPPAAQPAVPARYHVGTKRISPAYWLWQHTHARKGSLVAANCQHAEHGGYACKLIIQRSSRFRECWYLAVVPATGRAH